MPVDDKIKIFDDEDNKLKLLGELLSNDTSRRIIKMLIGKESYTNEISKKLDIRVSLVIHHLKKLEELGVLEITHKQIVRKGNNHRYFRMIPGLFLVPSKTKEEIEESGFLKKFFREGIKFTGIGLMAITSFLTYNKIQTEITWANTHDVSSMSLEIPFLIIIIGLSILLILNKKRKG